MSSTFFDSDTSLESLDNNVSEEAVSSDNKNKLERGPEAASRSTTHQTVYPSDPEKKEAAYYNGFHSEGKRYV